MESGARIAVEAAYRDLEATGPDWGPAPRSGSPRPASCWRSSSSCSVIGLLFLLMKEKKTTGHVQVTVSGGGRYHTTSIPVSSPEQVIDLMNRVNYARSLCI